MKKLILISLIISFLPFIPKIPEVRAQLPVTLEEGIRQYQQENFEEAIEILTQVRKKDPSSPQAAFFLGMAYKQALEFTKAAQHLRDAATLRPAIREAVVELIDTYYQMNLLEEAKKWLELAEKEKIAPARIAFLKGLILSRENRNQEAIAAFEKAKQLEPAFAQVADFQIGICLIKDRRLDRAKDRLQAVISKDPLSDLATFARQYLASVEEGLFLERPLRLTVGIFAGYDTNIVAKPLESSAAGDITDEEGTTLTTTVRLDYVPRLEGPWLFNAQYTFASVVNSKHTHSHDSLANSFSLSPGYNFGRFAVNLNLNYTNYLLRTDPDLVPAPDSSPGYKHYLDYVSLGPAIRVFLNQANLLEVFAGYEVKNYYNQKITGPDSIRDAEGLRTYLSWIWLFRENAFLNLRYDYTRENADGRQWSNDGHRVSANLTLPLMSDQTARRLGPLTLQLAGSAFFQDYKYEVNYGTVTETRKDRVYVGSLGLAWRFYKYASLIGQYTRTQNKSNVPIYEYNRDQYALGLEFRY